MIHETNLTFQRANIMNTSLKFMHDYCYINYADDLICWEIFGKADISLRKKPKLFN